MNKVTFSLANKSLSEFCHPPWMGNPTIPQTRKWVAGFAQRVFTLTGKFPAFDLTRIQHIY
jgi:ribosomal protein L31